MPNSSIQLPLDDAQILALRTSRNRVDSRYPYAFLNEKECDRQGNLHEVSTLFLTNRECPYRCLMCDLWKNTLTDTVAPGDIPHQIEWALAQLPQATSIKLYNSGNFFDPQAIPVEDYEAIAKLVRKYQTVIVENHPNLCGKRCLEFQDLIAPAQLEIALGIETCHEPSLRLLNKQMTLANVEHAAKFLHDAGIEMRAFLIHQLPGLSEGEAIHWTGRSIAYAQDLHINACSIIPMRTGNGAMDALQLSNQFVEPSGRAIEEVFEQGMENKKGRLFLDLWDAQRFFKCHGCQSARIDRLQQMNWTQSILPKVVCNDCGATE